MTTAQSAPECQQKCQDKDGCKWFTWKDGNFPEGCWLVDTVGVIPGCLTDPGTCGATGPPVCPTMPNQYVIDVSQKYGVSYEGINLALDEARDRFVNEPNLEIVIRITSGIFNIDFPDLSLIHI